MIIWCPSLKFNMLGKRKDQYFNHYFKCVDEVLDIFSKNHQKHVRWFFKQEVLLRLLPFNHVVSNLYKSTSSNNRSSSVAIPRMNYHFQVVFPHSLQASLRTPTVTRCSDLSSKQSSDELNQTRPYLWSFPQYSTHWNCYCFQKYGFLGRVFVKRWWVLHHPSLIKPHIMLLKCPGFIFSWENYFPHFFLSPLQTIK